jgi:tetratricopeptide (TPR) repeat protein
MLGEEHRSTLDTMNRLGDLYRYEGKYADAEALLSKSLVGLRRILGDEHPWTLGAMNNMALMREYQGKYTEAEALFSKALEGYRRVLGEEQPSTLNTTNNLADLYVDQSRFAEAAALLQRVLTVYGKTTPDAWSRYYSQRLLGASLAAQKKYPEAEPLLLSGYEWMVRLEPTISGVGPSDSELAVSRIVQLYEDWGKPEQATVWRQKLQATRLSVSP